MALWVAGISAHPKVFPKPIDKGNDNPQAADDREAYAGADDYKRMKCDIRRDIDCGWALEQSAP